MMGDAPTRRAIVAGGLMGLAAGAAYVAVPRASAAKARPELDATIPKSFSGWTADDSVTPLLPDADQQATIDRLYDETLARTYRGPNGRAVMLVIAYGTRQAESLQAHEPEVCYAAQGFRAQDTGTQALPAPFGAVVAKRVYATLGARTEPILYWLAVGNEIANFGFKLRVQQIKLGLRGIVPEGFLVRASLIGADEDASYLVLAQFLASMLAALPPGLRRRMASI